jgi:acetyl-CoA acetyltransferase
VELHREPVRTTAAVLLAGPVRAVRGGRSRVGRRAALHRLGSRADRLRLEAGVLACFGEAIPAQAIAQVCELTWQLKGQATGRQVECATAGITANQGLFSHGSSVVVAR